MTKSSKVAAIIPCCGYGTRMNMPIDKSKELLINPNTDEPLIEWHLELCKLFDIEPICIVRPEKQDLIDYLRISGVKTILYTPEEKQSWAETIYNNKDHYNEKNILLLPDTVFAPKKALKQVKNALYKYPLVFATHLVYDYPNWGIVRPNKLYEKPQSLDFRYIQEAAWGLIGFTDAQIFKDLIDKKESDIKNYKVININKFKDLTRTGKL